MLDGFDALYRMHDICKKKRELGVCWGLVGKISPGSPAFELRNSGVAACRQSSEHPSYLVHPKEVPSSIEEVSGRQMGPGCWPSEDSSPETVSRQSPVAFFLRLYLLGSPQPIRLTYLKQHLQPVQIFNQKI
jgi:hypothetical protein